MLKIRRPLGRLMFNMGIAIPGKTVFLIETAPWTYRFSDVIMIAMASEITCVWIVCPTVYSGADQRKHQSPASLAFARGIYRWPIDSSHRGPATRKIFPFDDVIMSRVQYLSLPRVKYEAAASYGCFQTYVFLYGWLYLQMYSMYNYTEYMTSDSSYSNLD